MRDNGIEADPDDALVYLQSEDAAGEFLDTCSKAQAEDIRNGWTVRMRMDEWSVRMYCGGLQS